jgi:hypothetical protein
VLLNRGRAPVSQLWALAGASTMRRP